MSDLSLELSLLNSVLPVLLSQSSQDKIMMKEREREREREREVFVYNRLYRFGIVSYNMQCEL